MQSIADYASLFNAALAVAIFGMLAGVANMMRQAERTRAEAITERLEGAKEHHNWLEKQHEVETRKLVAQNNALRVQLDEVLSGSGLTVESLATGKSLNQAAAETKEAVETLLKRLEAGRFADPGADPEIDLELAKGYMAQKNWAAAAERLDQYVRNKPDSFDVQFLRGVAWANTRNNNLSALRAYSEAVALITPDIGKRYAARTFIYRGAMLKRLNRPQEARNDLTYALELLGGDAPSYESDDARYNLAGISAMLGEKPAMMASLAAIDDQKAYRAVIRHHLTHYFRNFAEDPDLRAWLG